MVTRLPTPGADDGTWGDTLNTYLQVGHDSAGHNAGPLVEADKNSNYTIAPSDNGTRVVATAGMTFTVPAAGTLGNGFECEIINVSGSAVVIDGPGGTNVTLADGDVATLIEANGKQLVAAGASRTIATLTTPSAPTLALATASDSGSSSSDGITSNTAPDVIVTFATVPFTGDTVEIRDSSTTIVTHTITSGENGSSTLTLTLPTLSEGAHSLQCRQSRGAAAGAWGSALSVTIDTAGPALSGATGAQNGSTQTQADISVSTDTASGTMYWIVTANSTAPSAAQIKAAKDAGDANASASGSAAVSSAGAQSFTATSINVSNTYYAHFVQDDAAGNTSSVASSAGWTQTVVLPPATFAISYADAQDKAYGGAGKYTASGVTLGTGYFILFVADGTRRTKTGVTIAGVAATLLYGVADDGITMWGADINSATGDVVVTATASFGDIVTTGGILSNYNHTPFDSHMLSNTSHTDPQLFTASTIPTNGIGIAVFTSSAVSSHFPAVWSGATRISGSEAEVATGNSLCMGLAVSSAAGSFNPTVSGTGGQGFGYTGARTLTITWGA